MKPRFEVETIDAVLKNEQKVNSLYAAFRAKEANPVDYEYKMSFWKNAILTSSSSSGHLSFSMKMLLDHFKHHGKTPLGLKIVLEQMLRDGDIVSKQDYDNSRNTGWLRWGVHTFITRPVRWSLSFLTSAWQDDIENTEFVITNILPSVQDKVLEQHYRHVRHELVDDTLEIDELYEQCKDVCSTKQDLLMILWELEKQKKVVIKNKVDSSLGMVVKFSHRKSQNGRLRISDVDIGILKLRHTIKSVNAQISQLCDQVTACQETARSYIRNGNKSQAKNSLKKKRRLELLIEKKETTLDNLNQLLHNLEESDTDAMIFESYKVGVASLKQSNAQVSVGNINDTFDDIQEALSEYSEVTDALSTPVTAPGAAGGEVSQDELESELDHILSTPRQEEERRRPVGFQEEGEEDEAALLAELDRLPDVPSSTPTPAAPAAGVRKRPENVTS